MTTNEGKDETKEPISPVTGPPPGFPIGNGMAVELDRCPRCGSTEIRKSNYAEIMVCANCGHSRPGLSGREVLGHQEPPKRPTIVTLCGSIRFPEAWAEATKRETLAGRIVLSVGFWDHPGLHRPEGAELKARLDELHKRKIDLSDEVLVLNVGKYVGEPTKSEVFYAARLGKKIRWLELPDGSDGVPCSECGRALPCYDHGRGCPDKYHVQYDRHLDGPCPTCVREGRMSSVPCRKIGGGDCTFGWEESGDCPRHEFLARMNGLVASEGAGPVSDEACRHAEPFEGGERHTFETGTEYPTAAKCRLCGKDIAEILGDYERKVEQINRELATAQIQRDKFRGNANKYWNEAAGLEQELAKFRREMDAQIEGFKQGYRASFPQAQAEGTYQANEELKKELRRVSAGWTEVNQRLGALQTRAEGLEEQVASETARANAYANEAAELKKKLDAAHAEITRLTNVVADLIQEAGNAKAEGARYAREKAEVELAKTKAELAFITENRVSLINLRAAEYARMVAMAKDLAAAKDAMGNYARELNETRVERNEEKARVEAAEAELRRFYHADGSFDEMPTIEAALERRKAAAKEIAELRRRLNAHHPHAGPTWVYCLTCETGATYNLAGKAP